MDLLLWVFERFKEPLWAVLWSGLIALLVTTVPYWIALLVVGRPLIRMPIRGLGIESRLKRSYYSTFVASAIVLIVVPISMLLFRKFQDTYTDNVNELANWLSSLLPQYPEWLTLMIALVNIASWIYVFMRHKANPKGTIIFAERGVAIRGAFYLWREISSITFEPKKLRVRLLSDLFVYDCDIDRQALMALRDSLSKKVKMDYTSFLA